MNFKKLIVCFLTLAFLSSAAMSQDRREMATANMSRALEAYQNNDLEEMLKYLALEEQNNSKNGYAYSWHAFALLYNTEYGKALDKSTLALKYLPKKDKEYLIFTHQTRSDVYAQLEDYDKALDELNAAIKLDSKMEKSYEKRGEIYYQMKKYDLSDKDYKQCLKLNENSLMGMMGLGRNAQERGACTEANEYFNKVIKLYGSTYSSGYSFRAECYIKQGMFSAAADDIVNALYIDRDRKAFYWMLILADSSYMDINSRLKIQKNKEPKNEYWDYCLAAVASETHRYDKAVEYLTNAAQNSDFPHYYYNLIAESYNEDGQYYLALKYANMAVEGDTSAPSYRLKRVEVNYNLDNYQAIMDDLNYCIEQIPDQDWCYSTRAWYRYLYGDTEGAIEDLTSAASLNQDDAHTFMSRGKILLETGNKAAGRKDLLRAIEIDTAEHGSMQSAMYAYYYLGDNFNAQRLLDTNLANDGSKYDAACMYSLMGYKKKALDYLKKAFEEGLYTFNHMNRDKDLDNIRNEQEFKDLVEKYKAEWQAKLIIPNDATANYTEKVVEVPFERTGGVTKVKCSINGLPLYFIFDTGASDVSMSSVEAAFMFKNGYLSAKDVVGRRNYLTASGDVVEGTVITIAEIDFGGLKLTNVRASVTKRQSAPLLLGQTVLSRLGKIEIDNNRNVLKITYQEEK